MGKKKKVGKERIDKYYKLAKTAGYRARSAFKLIQIAQKYNIFKDAKILIDLCAAPGGWLQVAYKNMNKHSTIIGIDLVPIRKIDDNVITIKSDITSADCIRKIKGIIQNEKADVILNDGAPNVGTTYSYDSYNQNILVLHSIKIASLFLKKRGIFITKVFRNEEYVSLIWVLEKLFSEVKHVKPRSSREISSEIYLIALNFLNNKVDKKLFDYTYVFSDEFKNDSNKLSSLHNKNDPDSSDSNDDEEKKKKSKKKKGLSTILKEKKKKNRQGYNIGDDYRATDICNFINSDNYIDLLMKNNKFTFDKNYINLSDSTVKTTYNCIYKNEATTEEIFHLCNDLKILGKSDLFHLIKWRYKIKKDFNKNITKNCVKEEKENKENEEEDEIEEKKEKEKEKKIDDKKKKDYIDENIKSLSEDELSHSSDNSSEKDEINKFSSYIKKKEIKEKKKKEKKLKKEIEKKNKAKQSLKIDNTENEIHFNKDMLKLLKKQKFEDHLNVLNNNDDEKLEISEENYSSSGEGTDFNLKKKNNSKLNELEYLVNLDYEKQKMKEKKLQEDKQTDKVTRRKRAMDYKNEELMKIQKIMELKNEELLMKKKLDDYLSDEESSDDNSSTEKNESALHNNELSENEYFEDQNDKTHEALKENLHIQSVVNKIIRLRKDVKKKENEEETPNTSRFFDQKIFQNIFNQLDDETNDEQNNVTKKSDIIKNKDISVLKEKEEYAEIINNSTSNDDIKEVDEKKLPKIPLPEKLAKKEKKKKLKEKYGNNEIKMKNSSFSIVKTDDKSQNINNYFSNLIKDEDELAFIRCIGEKLIHKKSRMDLIDDSFNRNSYLEDEDMLPDWFLEEEKKFRKPIIPIDKKILDQYKSKINKITKMPIKKVIEAKMRNKKREIAKMKKLEAKIGKIEKNEEDPFLQQKAITNLLKKNKSDKKREKSYIVCSGKGSKIANKKKKKGGKSIAKYVDKRLKKDKRAKKRIEKKRKKISKTKYSKSKPFKFRRT